VNLGRFLWVGLVACALLGCGGGTFRDIRTPLELKPGERLLFGEVLAEGAPLSEYAIGAYLGTEVVFDRVLPNHELSSSEMVSVGDGVGEEVGRNGGTFLVAAPESELYLLGVRVQGLAVVRTVRFLATPARIPATSAKCAYVGTLVIRPAAAGIDVELRDDLAGALARGASKVKGCQLERRIAERVDASRLVQIELPNSKPPEVDAVDLREHSASYPVHGTGVAALQRGLRDSGLSGDAAAQTNAQLAANFYCRKYSDGYALEKATVRLDLTTTLPDWQDRERVSEALRHRWDALFAALVKHEAGHRQIAIEHADKLREALTALKPGPSCEAVQQAAEDLHRDWSGRLSDAQVEYDRQTHHGIDQGAVL
jgi:predicted secreted Zn-dependent protease